MKRNLTLLAVAVLFVISAAAQKPTISFKVKEYDFGQVNEEDGKITHVFEFTNTGSAPLLIQRVQASCGCTTPDWTKEPVEPGKTGKITATYNPQGRPNGFVKTITVYSNATNETEVLTIKGNVIPKNQTPVNNYPMQMGALKYNTRVIQMNNVAKGKSQTRSLLIKNTSNAEMKVDVANLPASITAVAAPATLKAGEEGKVDFTFNSNKTSTWGQNNNDVYLVLNGKKVLTDEYKIGFLTNVTEDFNNMSVQDKRNAPILEIKSPNIYLGQITKGHTIRGKVAVKNSGINSLDIRRIVNNNPEVIVHPLASVKGGKTSELKIDVDSKSLTAGNYTRIFTMQTNDPQNPVVVFNLSWQVK